MPNEFTSRPCQKTFMPRKNSTEKSGIRNPAQHKVAMITIYAGSLSAVIGGVEMKVIQNNIARSISENLPFSSDLTLLSLCSIQK